MADAPAATPEDILAPLKQYAPTEKLTRARDMVAGHYRILTAQPIPELDSPFAKAYGVRDEDAPDTPLYGLVFSNAALLRPKHTTLLKGWRHSHMVTFLEDGVTEITGTNESRYVTVLERPVGQSLFQLLSEGKNPVPEPVLINYLLKPLAELLIALAALGISHNRINLKNVYLSKHTILLGECISEPSGYSQDPLFEPIDRLLAEAAGKPDFGSHADFYALGVLAIHLVLGFQPFAQMDRRTLIQQLLTKGPYHTFAIEWDLTDTLQDLLRGIFSDTRHRSEPEQITQWFAGRRFNLILPSPPRETSRGFEFIGGPYLNRKALAQALFTHWQEGRSVLADNHLPRWLETGVHKPDVAEAVTRLIGGNYAENLRSERQSDDLLARVIMTLDPAGPIRFKTLCVTVDGLGTLLASEFLSEHHENVQILAQIMESDLAGFWVEQHKGVDYSGVLQKIQKARAHLRVNGLGFGIERCLYDLVPTLPCQSPLVKRYHIRELGELLLALDSIAPAQAGQQECMDRHIAAFIASKLAIAKEIRVYEVDVIAELATHPKLIALKLLARAQQKAEVMILKGLSAWMAASLLPLTNLLHRRAARGKLQASLKAVAGSGSLQAISDVLLSPNAFPADYHDFRETANHYAANHRLIAELKNENYLARHMRIASRGIAQFVAYSISILTLYFTLRPYFHF